MQPSTHQTAPGASLADLPAGLLALVVVAGSAGLFATYWDDAWQASFGRDAVLWSPPHVLAVFGSLTLLAGFLGAARPDTSTRILTGLGRCCWAARPCRAAAPHPHAQSTKQGAPDMPLLLLFIALVVLAILAPRFGVDSRDGADWSPPDWAPDLQDRGADLGEPRRRPDPGLTLSPWATPADAHPTERRALRGGCHLWT